jgi:class 3 adenylate cyclase
MRGGMRKGQSRLIVWDFTMPGDAVNITPQLASAADAGEVIASTAAAEAAQITTDTSSAAPWKSLPAPCVCCLRVTWMAPD